MNRIPQYLQIKCNHESPIVISFSSFCNMMVEDGPLASVILHRPQQQQQQQFSPINNPDTDLGNVTIEHVDGAGSEENPETLLLIEEKSQPVAVTEDDILDIGMFDYV